MYWMIYLDGIRKKLNIDTIHGMGITGKKVGVAIIDTGTYFHTDLKHGLLSFSDFINNRKSYYDDNGHGTHVAGIIGGNGKKSGGKYKGIAPDSKLIIVKCLDYKGNGSIKNALAGFDFIIKNKKKYNIRIVNISLGTAVDNKEIDMDSLIEGVEELWKKDLVVVAAAGNNGPQKGSVTAPGCAKSIITVGASDVQKKYDKNVYDFSGRGPTNECIIKPEIVCPGIDIISCDVAKTGYTIRSGTSMSAPIVSGVIALVLEKYPDLTNKDIKKRLYMTAIDLGIDKSVQGWGMINPLDMLR